MKTITPVQLEEFPIANFTFNPDADPEHLKAAFAHYVDQLKPKPTIIDTAEESPASPKHPFVAMCLHCGFDYTEYNTEIEDMHFLYFCPDAPQELKDTARKRLTKPTITDERLLEVSGDIFQLLKLSPSKREIHVIAILRALLEEAVPEQDKGKLINCYITPRGDDTCFILRTDGTIVANLDGYVITPKKAA